MTSRDPPQEWGSAPRKDVDSGWAWVMTLVSFLTHSMTLGFAYGMGVFYVEFLQAFQESKAKTAWITSLNFFLLCGLGPITSLLVQKFGCRTTLAAGGMLSTVGLSAAAFATDVNTTMLTMGLIAGLGFGLCHVPIVVVITHYFHKYRTFAQGLTFSGAGVGTILYPWICRALIDTFGWRGALIMCAGINFHIVALAMLIPRKSPLQRAMEEIPLESRRKPPKVSGIKAFFRYFNLFKNVNFTMLCISNFFIQFGMYIVYTHLPAYAVSLHFSKTKADLLISIVGVFNLLGRAGLGFLGQLKFVDVPQLYVACFVFGGISVFGCAFWTSFTGIAICACLFGFLCGATGPLVVEFACIVLGLEDFNRGYGFLTVFMAFGNLLGAPSAGLVYDLTKFYPASFYLGGVCLVVCGLILVPTLFDLRKSKRSANYNVEQEITAMTEEEIPTIARKIRLLQD